MIADWELVGYVRNKEMHEDKCNLTLNVVCRKQDRIFVDEDEPDITLVYSEPERDVIESIQLGDFIYVRGIRNNKIYFISILSHVPEGFIPELKKLGWYN